MQTNTPPPATQFDWQIYADTTFAGLSLLILIPLLDVAFEWFFRRRMAHTIARRNQPFAGNRLSLSPYPTLKTAVCRYLLVTDRYEFNPHA